MHHIRRIIKNNNGQSMRVSRRLEQQLVHRQIKVQVLAAVGVLLPCGPGAEILVVVVLSCAPVACCPSGHGGDLPEGTRCSELPADRVNVLGPKTSLVRCSSGLVFCWPATPHFYIATRATWWQWHRASRWQLQQLVIAPDMQRRNCKKNCTGHRDDNDTHWRVVKCMR